MSPGDYNPPGARAPVEEQLSWFRKYLSATHRRIRQLSVTINGDTELHHVGVVQNLEKLQVEMQSKCSELQKEVDETNARNEERIANLEKDNDRLKQRFYGALAVISLLSGGSALGFLGNILGI